MSPAHEKLIAKQALKIEELEAEVKEYANLMKLITNKLVCIGGPLNDNKLGYTPEQLKLFDYIYNITRD